MSDWARERKRGKGSTHLDVSNDRWSHRWGGDETVEEYGTAASIAWLETDEDQLKHVRRWDENVRKVSIVGGAWESVIEGVTLRAYEERKKELTVRHIEDEVKWEEEKDRDEASRNKCSV